MKNNRDYRHDSDRGRFEHKAKTYRKVEQRKHRNQASRAEARADAEAMRLISVDLFVQW